MKQITILLAALALCMACSTREPVQNRAFCVSILPLKSIVEQIVGDDFEIQVIVPKGASPETFEPTPRQFVEINKARMIFSVGLIDFENSLINKIQDKDKIVNLSRGIQLIEGSCTHVTNRSATDAVANEGLTANRPEEHSHAHGVDPHIWTSPKALEIMAKNAFDAIRTAYPDSIKYEENYKRLIQKIEKSDERVREKINRSGLKYFIIYHPALTYLARDYGICQVAIESEGKEPSARRLSELIDRARRDSVRVLLYQSQFPASTVEVIASDIGATSRQIDPLAEDVERNILDITDLIVSSK